MKNFLNSVQPERNIDGFSKNDSAVIFYSFVRAIMIKQNCKKVLDFGAGRGSFYYLNTSTSGSLYRKHLQDLRFNGAEVTAADVDEVVKQHPCSHSQVVLEIGKPLPFENETFDIIVSDWTFEHISEPQFMAQELLRILKPGGYICARTTNAYSYLRLVASIIPNRLHKKVLSKVQPGRLAEDIFPTAYKFNSPKQLKFAFLGHSVYLTRMVGDPSYYFGNRLAFNFFQLLHKLLPERWGSILMVFIHKNEI